MKKFLSTALLAGASALSADPSKKAMVGTNLGGWMVLEPWITPSLFYRFLGNNNTESQVGLDSYTFCEALGPEDGNALLKSHWDNWITDDYVQQLKDREVEIVRVPIGDWMVEPYGPYVGCYDGAMDKVDEILKKLKEANIYYLIDVHGAKDSQNGFDNSGKAHKLNWINGTHFEHWPVQAGEWMGEWDSEANGYANINYANIQYLLNVCEKILKRWGTQTYFKALEPLNEPWTNSDMTVLKEFYKRAQKMTAKLSPHATFVFHDAYVFDPELWNGLFDKTDNVALDTHFYTSKLKLNTTDQYCEAYANFSETAKKFENPIWVGEWSLATDYCGMWLGGLNDGHITPQRECSWNPCPDGYLPDDFKKDFDREADVLGPFGTLDPKVACVHKGNCSKDSDYFNQTQVATIAECALKNFNENTAAQFLWTARTEIEDRWNYVQAYDLGWLNQTKAVSSPAEFGMTSEIFYAQLTGKGAKDLQFLS